MSGQTIVLPPEEASEEVADAVIKLSQETYARKYVKPADTEAPKKKPGKDSKGSDGKKGKDGGKPGDGKGGDSTDALDSNDDR